MLAQETRGPLNEECLVRAADNGVRAVQSEAHAHIEAILGLTERCNKDYFALPSLRSDCSARRWSVVREFFATIRPYDRDTLHPPKWPEKARE